MKKKKKRKKQASFARSLYVSKDVKEGRSFLVKIILKCKDLFMDFIKIFKRYFGKTAGKRL